MHTFILVHGAWHGGDVWQPLVKELQTVGKQASAVTLTGLGERKHLLSDAIDLETHIQDVVGHIESQDFDEVTLVGWSYGGMVIAGVLPRITQRVKAMVYVDAFVPDKNMALIDYILAPEGKTYYEEFKNSRQAIPPPPFEFFGMRDSYWISHLAPRVSPHPWKTFFQPVQTYPAAREVRTSYVYCKHDEPTPLTATWEKLKAEQSIGLYEIETNHYCMLTHPKWLTTVLLD
jgi:pimeloyl-ACP methyl ester carboxylesterase